MQVRLEALGTEIASRNPKKMPVQNPKTQKPTWLCLSFFLKLKKIRFFVLPTTTTKSKLQKNGENLYLNLKKKTKKKS